MMTVNMTKLFTRHLVWVMELLQTTSNRLQILCFCHP